MAMPRRMTAPQPRRQTIQAIGEVGGIAFRQKGPQAQRPDQRTQFQHPAKGERHLDGQPTLLGWPWLGRTMATSPWSASLAEGLSP